MSVSQTGSLDTIVRKGHKQAIISLTERESRLSLTSKLQTIGVDDVEQPVPVLLKPLTKFARHETIAKTLNADSYFAHPYASWKRGLNENTNGLVRQYFSKGCDFSTIIQEEIQAVMDELTQQPSKKVPWREYTYQVFFNIDPILALGS